MNLFKKLSTLIFIFSLFVLGTILVPAHKTNAAVTVNVSAVPTSVKYLDGSKITWTSSAGVTSCSLYRSDTKATVYNLPYSGSYPTGALTKTTTFTVTCTIPVVNGQCQNVNNSCFAGTLNDIADSSTYYLWQCLGSGGGTDASCSLAKSSGGGTGVCTGSTICYQIYNEQICRNRSCIWMAQ